MVRPETKSPRSPGDKTRAGGLTRYPLVVLSILLLLTIGATVSVYQNSLAFQDPTGFRWTPVVFLIGICVSLVIFAMTLREAAARSVLHQKTLDLIEAKKQNEALLVAEQNARVAAEQANLAKDQFLAVVSHELKTPLHAIAGWNSILKTGKASEETREAAVAKIDKNLRMQTAIIEELLSFSEIMASGEMIVMSPVRLRDVLEDAAAIVSIAAFQKGITFEMKNMLDDEKVSGDYARLKIAFVNVLSNAVKFTSPGGNIKVTAFSADDTLKCVISDDGEGISAEFIPHVFDQYRQSELVTTRHHGGLGLGLTIADQIVKLHNGTIEGESAGVGKGSTFTISIPYGK